LLAIADTFTGSLARLTAEEQKQVKTTAFDLQLNPEDPAHQFHRLQKAKNPTSGLCAQVGICG
jgi:mRNA-degrading endonuclease RelE of RelBE toxin-antitoxin system